MYHLARGKHEDVVDLGWKGDECAVVPKRVAMVRRTEKRRVIVTEEVVVINHFIRSINPCLLEGLHLLVCVEVVRCSELMSADVVGSSSIFYLIPIPL